MIEYLIFPAAVLFLAFVLTLAERAIRSRYALYKFLKTYKGLPVPLDHVSWLDNHASKWIFDENCLLMDELHRKHGKYVGGLVHDMPCVSTTDLDLIKTVVLDSASKNINRPELVMPMKEFQTDCILFANNDQWRRIRRAFAPALK